MNLSIIIPVYNGEKYIEECINNVLEQAYNDFELIIVNDGSKDDTKKICEKISKVDGRIKIINTENAGVSSARNKGINIAKGKYIVFLDADDKILSDIYKNMIMDIERENADLIMCSYLSEFDNRSEKNIFAWSDRLFEDIEIKEEVMKNTVSSIKENGEYKEVIMGSIWRCLFKRELLEVNNIRFRENLKYSEDLVFVLEYLNISKRVYTTNKCYYLYNRKTEDLSTTQKYIDCLESNTDEVHKTILDILNIKDFKNTKGWALKEVSSIYTLAVNIAINDNGISFFKKAKEIQKMQKRREFKKYVNKLNINEYYGLNKIVILSLKYKLYFLIVKYYSKKWKSKPSL